MHESCNKIAQFARVGKNKLRTQKVLHTTNATYNKKYETTLKCYLTQVNEDRQNFLKLYILLL